MSSFANLLTKSPTYTSASQSGQLSRSESIESLYSPAVNTLSPQFINDWNRQVKAARQIWQNGMTPGGGAIQNTPPLQYQQKDLNAKNVVARIFNEQVINILNCYGTGAWQFLSEIGISLRRHGFMPMTRRPNFPSKGVQLANGEILLIDNNFADNLAWSLRIAKLATEDLVSRFPGSLALPKESRSAKLWDRNNPKQQAEPEYQFMFELAYVISGYSANEQRMLMKGALEGAFTGGAKIQPFHEIVTTPELISLSSAQFEKAWKFRREREPDGTKHPSYTKNFNELSFKHRIFIIRLTQALLEAHRGLPQESKKHLVEDIGQAITDVGVQAGAIEAVDQPKQLVSVPTANRDRYINLQPNLFFRIGQDEHLGWQHMNSWTRTLPDASLHHAEIRSDGAQVDWQHLVQRIQNRSILSVLGMCVLYNTSDSKLIKNIFYI
jgi:hypothetical protein